MTRRYRVALGVFLLVAAATWVHPLWPVEQALHHSLTLVALVALVWVQGRRRLPFSSFVLILVFLTVHTVAARWIYSFVPYDDWSQALFGTRLSDVFGWRRNNFDRFVHFTYGACLAPVLWRACTDRLRWRRGWSALAAVDVVLSTGALYELFEWGIAVVLAPDMAEAYNGQQGDMFDPQKDMAIAVLGAVLSLAVTVALAPRRVSPGRDPLPPAVAAGAHTGASNTEPGG